MKRPDAYIFGRETARTSPWTPAEVEKVCLRARAAADRLRAAGPDYVLDTLAEVGRFCSDERSPWYREAFRQVREQSGFSRETIAASMKVLPAIFDRGEMEKRLRLELFLPGALDACVAREGYDGLVTAVPRGVVLHVGAGNVFLGIIDSLLMGMLTRNANVVKTASGGAASMVHFARALKKCDRRGLLASSVAVLSWPGGAAGVEEAAARSVDAVMVWGGEEAVAAYRRAAPSQVHVAGFGPKVSMAVVFPSALGSAGADAVAERLARDASVWEQNACSSPHTAFIVDPDLRRRDPLARGFCSALSAAFEKLRRELPPAELSFDEQVEITRARELAKADMAVGEASLRSSFPSTAWTVISEKDPVFRVSALNRTLYVKCVASFREVEKAAAAYRGHVQTAGVAGTMEEREEAARRLAPLGIARVTRLGAMLESPAGSPHDGTFPMRELVRFTGVEGGPAPADVLSGLVEHAREKSPFYRRHLRGVKKIFSEEEFRSVPLLTKEHILANTPPDSSDMFTGPVGSGVYFASGGSTGSPKYIFYDWKEFDRLCRMVGRAYMSAGLGAEDRAANLFVAGNLWSSWVGVERALSTTPAVSVPVGSALPMESIVKYLSEFRVTAIIGLPSFLLKLAQYCEEDPARRKFPLRYIFYGGEYVGPEMRAYFGRVFPGVRLRSGGYATVDAGLIGYHCAHCEGGVHHLMRSEQYLEILDPETWKPVSGGGVGELVVTVLNKRHMPIIRFRTGDLGRWLEGPCACGGSDPRFEILGRCDDRIHAGGAHIFVSDISRAIASVKGLSLHFQVEISAGASGDRLKLRVETRGAAPAPKGTASALLAALRKNCRDMADSLDMKWLAPPELELLPPGAIERVARTGKIRRVIDRRVKA
jgi:phenylacetate-coenzyme A ligase PaaK-like adenylate-forming protein